MVKEVANGPNESIGISRTNGSLKLTIVQMAEPSLSARNTGDPLPTGPRATIHLGDAPGFDIATSRTRDDLLIKDGAECIERARTSRQLALHLIGE